MAMCSQIEIAIRIRLARSGLSTEQRIQRAELHEDLIESFWANNERPFRNRIKEELPYLVTNFFH
jgi:hypothetical protein